MEENEILSIGLLVLFPGLVIIVGIVWFGCKIIRVSKINFKFIDLQMCKLNGYCTKSDICKYDEIPQIVHDSYTEYLQRRNEFWIAYGQVLLAILIVIVLVVLLMTKTISEEAGLPILSGIFGFAIAKGVSTAKSGSMPQHRKNNEKR